MKLTLRLVSSILFLGGSLFAQVPGMMTMQPASVPQGTDLGANTTVNAAGIALGNRVKLRGFVDFTYNYGDINVDDINASASGKHSDFSTTADLDFLFDFSPVTGEIHLAASTSEISLEQAFIRYSFNRDFNLSMGRQLTVLSYEGDEPRDLYSTSYGYFSDALMGNGAFAGAKRMLVNTIDSNGSLNNANLRRNYVDGIRANFNNGRFGLSLGLHDGYWVNDHFNDNNIALDIAASLMIIPGLEARIGYAHQDTGSEGADDNIQHFNAWLEYNPGNLTLAFEYDNFDVLGTDIWDIMLLGNYQFNSVFGLTLKYAHEDLENASVNLDSDRISLALLFAITDQLGFNVEYSHTEFDIANAGDGDADEFYLEGLFNF
jgi:hypothetical protein